MDWVIRGKVNSIVRQSPVRTVTCQLNSLSSFQIVNKTSGLHPKTNVPCLVFVDQNNRPVTFVSALIENSSVVDIIASWEVNFFHPNFSSLFPLFRFNPYGLQQPLIIQVLSFHDSPFLIDHGGLSHFWLTCIAGPYFQIVGSPLLTTVYFCIRTSSKLHPGSSFLSTMRGVIDGGPR